ncbi:unnamed protein product [Caenorhabditis sp. 36 PRJEB53466]|nr:unnamed protein product [Caenorhabditis sp. 36 PRJEB53466]
MFQKRDPPPFFPFSQYQSSIIHPLSTTLVGEISKELKMEFGAAIAYKKIDAQVETTLQAAAQVLRELDIQQDDEISEKKQQKPKKKTLKMTHKAVSVTSCSMSSCDEQEPEQEPEPKATIRTPIDARNRNRKIYFPPAKIGFVSFDTSDVTSMDPITTTPDSLFPSAIYIPAGKGAKQVISSSSSSCESSRRSTCSDSDMAGLNAGHHIFYGKMGNDPLFDIKHLKCRVKKSKPDSLFPEASYDAGTGKPILELSPMSSAASSEFSRSSSADTSSLIYQPMEFTSKDGRVKMLLQPMEAKKEKATLGDFPIVPKQLESCHKLKIERTKFSTKLAIGAHSIDLSGIFSGPALKKEDLTKLIINGQSYSI